MLPNKKAGFTITRASKWLAPFSCSGPHSARARRRNYLRTPPARRLPAVSASSPSSAPAVARAPPRRPSGPASPRLRSTFCRISPPPCCASAPAARPRLATSTFVKRLRRLLLPGVGRGRGMLHTLPVRVVVRHHGNTTRVSARSQVPGGAVLFSTTPATAFRQGAESPSRAASACGLTRIAARRAMAGFLCDGVPEPNRRSFRCHRGVAELAERRTGSTRPARDHGGRTAIDASSRFLSLSMAAAPAAPSARTSRALTSFITGACLALW